MALSYIGAGVVLMGAIAACRPGPLVPNALAPASRDSAVAWARAAAPRHVGAIRFKWRYEDRKLNAAGRGTARVAPPDSVRLDYAASLGLSSGAGVVVGDSVIWADPDQDFRSFIRGVPMFWAAIGAARPPGPHAAVFGDVGAGTGARRIWRFVAGADTLDYRSVGAPRLESLDAEWRSGGTTVARSHTEYDRQGWPARAQVEFPDAGARFELTVVGVDTTVVVPPALWRARR